LNRFSLTQEYKKNKYEIGRMINIGGKSKCSKETCTVVSFYTNKFTLTIPGINMNCAGRGCLVIAPVTTL
jgi:hypothetical protein